MCAVESGHDVTVFNRGRTNAGLFSDVPRIVGDRRMCHPAVFAGRKWDCVIDVSGYRPDDIRPVLSALRGRFEHYTFVSSVAVYRDPTADGAAEDWPTLQVSDSVSD